MKNNTRRIELLDELRGFAIIAMIFHHFFLDVWNILDIDWGYDIFVKLCTFQPIFWGIFIVISGICSRLSRNTIKRGIIVFACGMAITVATAVIMPMMGITGTEIYFGILHFLGIAMIITGLLMPLIKKINPVVGITVSMVLFLFTYSINDRSLLFGLIPLPTPKTNILMPLGLFNNSFFSADYFSIFPWIFLFFIGAFIGKYAKAGAFPEWTYKKRIKPFAFVGRNSLWFYLGHQVVIYALLYGFLEALKIYVRLTT